MQFSQDMVLLGMSLVRTSHSNAASGVRRARALSRPHDVQGLAKVRTGGQHPIPASRRAIADLLAQHRNESLAIRPQTPLDQSATHPSLRAPAIDVIYHTFHCHESSLRSRHSPSILRLRLRGERMLASPPPRHPDTQIHQTPRLLPVKASVGSHTAACGILDSLRSVLDIYAYKL